MFIKVLLRRGHHAGFDRLRDLGVPRKVPLGIHVDRKRLAPFEIPVRQEMFLAALERPCLDRIRYIGVAGQVSRLVEVHADQQRANHAPDFIVRRGCRYRAGLSLLETTVSA